MNEATNETKEAPVWSREANGIVHLRLTQDDWEQLLWALGVAAAAPCGGDVHALNVTNARVFQALIRLANRLNEGNRDFVPYRIPDEEAI